MRGFLCTHRPGCGGQRGARIAATRPSPPPHPSKGCTETRVPGPFQRDQRTRGTGHRQRLGFVGMGRARVVAAKSRYAMRWRRPGPPGVLSVDYFRPPLSAQTRLHLRILLGWDQPLRAAAMAPLTAWQILRWYAGGSSAAVKRVKSVALERYAATAETGGGTRTVSTDTDDRQRAGAVQPAVEPLRQQLRALLRRHTITAREALGYGLLDIGGSGADRQKHPPTAAALDDEARSEPEHLHLGTTPAGEAAWPLFIYDHEESWNLAVSVAVGSPGSRALPNSPSAQSPSQRRHRHRQGGSATARLREHRRRVQAVRTQIAALSDKHETAQRLIAVGIPTVETMVLAAGGPHNTAGLIRRATQRWPNSSGYFVKPRSGSRGIDCYILTRADADGVPPAIRSELATVRAGGSAWMATTYHPETNSPASPDELDACLSAQDYLVQPLLRSPQQWRGVAADTDVVTVRIVTRDVGSAPAVFSRVAEFPLPPRATGQFYLLVGLDAEGVVRTLAAPEHSRAGLDPASLELWQQVTGRHVCDGAAIDELAIRAHRQFPGMFAVAWDVALTDDGPVFLEGNAGFGTTPPQLVAGGLLNW